MTDLFEVTRDHLKLIKCMYWEFNTDMYDGCPAVDIKRPYGNSNVWQDIAEILGIEKIETDDEPVYPKGTREMCMKLHRETATCLQIITCNLMIKTGTYEKKSEYDSRSWRKVS